MSKNVTIRFAFGTQIDRGSAVWRINIRKNTGDVYIHNTPSLGGSAHIALHASGRFSMKLGSNKRIQLNSATELDMPNMWDGPSFFFPGQLGNLPPPIPTGDIDKIIWLGWPESGKVIQLRTIYFPHIETFPKSSSIICEPKEVKLFHKPMLLYLVLQTRHLEESEKLSLSKPESLDFKSTKPDYLELLKVQNNLNGTSSIVILNFNA